MRTTSTAEYDSPAFASDCIRGTGVLHLFRFIIFRRCCKHVERHMRGMRRLHHFTQAMMAAFLKIIVSPWNCEAFSSYPTKRKAQMYEEDLVLIDRIRACSCIGS